MAQLQEPVKAHERASEAAVALASVLRRALASVPGRAWVRVPARALEEVLEEVPHRACARHTQCHASQEPPDVRRGGLQQAPSKAPVKARVRAP